MRKNQSIVLFLLLFMMALSILVYTKMPSTIVTHWGSSGQADGFSNKNFGLFFLPLFSFLLYGLLSWLPNLDPKRKNIDLFKVSYENFLILFFLFFSYLHLLTILWNLGVKISFNQAFAPAIAALLFGTGCLIEKAKLNYMIGIRTPWTLANEEVWNETNRKGGQAFKISGIITLLGLFFPNYTIWFLISSILFVTIYTVTLSYIVYKKTMKKNNNG